MYDTSKTWEYYKRKKELEKKLQEGILTPKQFEEALFTLDNGNELRTPFKY